MGLCKEVILNALTEQVEVQAIDGKKYQVRIRALGEGEIMELLEQTGLDVLDIGNPEKSKANIKFQHAVCIRSTGEDAAKFLRFGQAVKLAVKILVLSGMPPSVEALSSVRNIR